MTTGGSFARFCSRVPSQPALAPRGFPCWRPLRRALSRRGRRHELRLHIYGREPVGVHNSRHTFVSLALASGASLAETAALARHANARVTAQVYAGITDDGRARAAAKLVEAGFDESET